MLKDDDAKQVREGGSHKIHIGTSTQDSGAVVKSGSSYNSCSSSRWLELQRLNNTIARCWYSTPKQLHWRPALIVNKRKLKRIVCGHPLSYYWMHVAYYGVLTVAGTTSLWWSCRGKETTMGFVDCVFNAVSTLTATGLSSVPLRDLTPLGLLVLMVLMLLGNTVFVSLLPVYVRRFQLFRHDRALHASNQLGTSQFPHHTADVNNNYVTLAKKNTLTSGSNAKREPIDISKSGILKIRDGQGICSPEIKSETLISKVASCCGNASGEGSQVSLSQAGARDTGWLERQALITLSWLIPIYMFIIMSFGFVCVLCYTSSSTSKGSSKIRALYKTEEVNPIHTAVFLSVSAFSNTGLSPLDENMVPFGGSPLVLTALAILILAGNTMFPPSLRFIIWCMSTLKRPDDPQRDVYEYLLQFPRRCYTHLFPRVYTMWLVATVVGFNTVDLVAFCALEWNLGGVTNAGVKLMDGLFQSINTRSAGMNVLPLSSLSPPLLVLYTSMMAIAAYPVFLSRQHSRLPRTDVNNLHQYSAKGVSEKFEATDAAGDKELLQRQFSKLFARDSAYIFITILLICAVESPSLNSDPLNFTIFSIAFEVVSAYGSVGLSLGYRCEQWVRASANTPYAEAAAACRDVPYSFSGKWRVGSKLILVSCMLLGRHRSLPDDMDPAVADVVVVITPSEPCDRCQQRCHNSDTVVAPSPPNLNSNVLTFNNM